MEALCSNEVFNLILYEPTPYNNYFPNSFPTSPNLLLENPNEFHLSSSPPNPNNSNNDNDNNNSVVPEIPQGRKKRRRRSSKVCKDKEEAESQRMTHIAVERNRRKLMNEHLAVLRSLMPDSYVERGDQASIVGGAITFVKELEHLLQTLEAKKIQQSHETKRDSSGTESSSSTELNSPTPFSQFFSFPQYSFCSQMPNKYSRSKSNGGNAEIEVTLIESHANIRVLCPRRPRQLSKLLSGFHSIYLTLLHLNVTTLDTLVLYSVSAKVEEGCQLKSADDIAMAVDQILKMIEEDANLSLA